MQSRDFIYWLQGFFEISGDNNLSPKQVEIIRNHLNMVFIHEIDPSMGDKKEQDKLQEAHDGPGYLPYNPNKVVMKC